MILREVTDETSQIRLIAFACALAPVNLVRAESACPATIVVEQRASAPAPDWTVSYSGYETAVAGVTIFDGPPAQQASLVPDNEKTSRRQYHPGLAITKERSWILAAVQLREYHRADRFAACRRT